MAWSRSKLFGGNNPKRGHSALGLSELAKGISKLRLPSTLKLRSCSRHLCSYRAPAQPMELTKRINSDTTSSEFEQSGVSHFSMYSPDQIGNPRLSASLVGYRFLFRRCVLMANCYETLQEWEATDPTMH
jgi:hypothetical protein